MNPFSNLLYFLEKIPLEIHWKNIIPMLEGSAQPIEMNTLGFLFSVNASLVQ
jgi:hypothetical protein